MSRDQNDQTSNQQTSSPILFGPDGEQIRREKATAASEEEEPSTNRSAKMTKAERWHAWINASLFVVTSILALFSYLQWKSTEKAANAAQSSAQAAISAVGIAEQSRQSGDESARSTLKTIQELAKAIGLGVEAQRAAVDVAKKSQRSHLSFREWEIGNVAPGIEIQVRYTINNLGHSPAILIEHLSGWVVGSKLPATPNYFSRRQLGQVHLPAGQKIIEPAILDGFDAKTYDEIKSGRVNLWIYGRYIYRDDLGQHISCSIVKYDAAINRLVIDYTPSYNCGD